MAFDTAILENPLTGQVKEAPLGFSWTMAIWGPFAPALRRDWLFVSSLLAALVLSFFLEEVIPWSVLVPSALNVGCAFIWNKSYLQRLVAAGFRLKGTTKGTSLDRVDYELGSAAPRLHDLGAQSAKPEQTQPYTAARQNIVTSLWGESPAWGSLIGISIITLFRYFHIWPFN